MGALALGSFSVGVAYGAAPKLVPAEISVPTQAARLKPGLRSNLRASLAKMDTGKLRGGPFLVSASLKRINTTKGKYGLQSTAVIQLTLRHKKSGAMVGVATGRATAILPGSPQPESERAAVQAAVSSAAQKLPKALR